MSVAITCGKCDKSLKVADRLEGKKIKCPGCGTSILVAAAIGMGDSIKLPKSPRKLSPTEQELADDRNDDDEEEEEKDDEEKEEDDEEEEEIEIRPKRNVKLTTVTVRTNAEGRIKPNVHMCARCGNPSTRSILQWFKFMPKERAQKAAAANIALALFTDSRVYAKPDLVPVHIPVCKFHANMYRNRWLMYWGPLALLGVILLFAMGVKAIGLGKISLGIGGLGVIVAFIAWPIVAIIGYRSVPRLTDKQGRKITLTGVAKSFAKAIAKAEPR